MCFPFFCFARAMPLMARLLASAPDEVKIISVSSAPIRAATLALDFSTARLASEPISYTLEGLAKRSLKYGSMDSTTSFLTGVADA